MTNRLILAMDKVLNTIVVIVCILLLLIGTYSLLDNLWLYWNAQDKSVLIYRPELDELLTADKKITENQVAWLYVDDTNIDYPVMQGKDNFEYLNKDPYGEFKLSGSIFLDSNNDPSLADEYSVIYGHHMERSTMFGALDDFKDKAYFDAHQAGWITTESAAYDYDIFAVAEGSGSDQALFDPVGRQTSEIFAYLDRNAIQYREPARGRRIVALSTCSGDGSEIRLLVFGTIKERATSPDATKTTMKEGSVI